MSSRDTFRKTVEGVFLALALYVVAYIVNSGAGGYWMTPGRDGQGRSFERQYGLNFGILWQPRFGLNAFQKVDYFGAFFGPLIALDRAWIHPTHNLGDFRSDAWLKALPSSKVHPKFREQWGASGSCLQSSNVQQRITYLSTVPGNLIVVGVVCTTCGLVLIWRAISGDTVVPGMTWTRVPKSLLWVMGLVLQTPFPLAYISLRYQGLLD